MELNSFINDFASQFDDTDLREFHADTKYRTLDEWSSLVGFAILNMIEKRYGVTISSSEIKITSTIEDVYNLILSKS